MKLVLTGSTGFIGSGILNQCCEDEHIESIVVLTRRPLRHDNVQNNKVTNLVMENFEVYDSNVIQAIHDADGCIWSLGGSGSSEVEVDYPLAFVKAITGAWHDRSIPFRYVHCSGILAEQDQTKSLWFLQDGRRAKGRAETELLAMAQQPELKKVWQTYILRPSMVVPIESTVLQRLSGLAIGSVKIDDLARAAVRLASRDNDQRVLENGEIIELGK